LNVLFNGNGIIDLARQCAVLAMIAGITLLTSAVNSATAATSDSADELEVVVISATRTAERSMDLPVSIDRVDREQIHQGQLEENLSESLGAVPGVSVQMRQNYAHDAGWSGAVFPI
jgi:iron complex outermembrane receptor protein